MSGPDVIQARFQGRVGALELDAAFEVPARGVTAVFGPSGAGKTTISSLVPRLYDVTGGAVRISGVDVRHATMASLRADGFPEPSISVPLRTTSVFLAALMGPPAKLLRFVDYTADLRGVMPRPAR